MAQTAKSKRKTRWFQSGVHAVNCVIDNFGDAYLCPICLNSFTGDQIDSDLSLEHAPPESVGGIEVALTCRSCNNHAGTAIDVHAKHQKTVYDFMSGRGDGSAKVTVTHGSVPIRSTMNFGPGGILVVGAGPKANNPEDVQRALEMVATGGPGGKFTIQFQDRFSHRLAKLSWVRAAYVAAFAWFGYRYVLNHAFDPLREQILQPNAEILPSLPIIGDPAQYGDASERGVATMSEPIETMVVSMGWLHVLLPGPSMPVDYFDTIDQRVREVTGAGAEGGRVTLSGKVTKLPWPDYPRHVWDGYADAPLPNFPPN